MYWEKIVNARPPVDLARIVLVILIVSLLVFGSLYIVRPFLPALLWSSTIVVASWPVMLGLQHRLGDRRWAAVTVMLIGMLILIVLPLYGAVATVATHAGEIMAVVNALPNYALPPPPAWLPDLPLVGARAAHEWQVLSDAGPGGILASLQPYAAIVARWLIERASAVGVLMIHLVITLMISGVLYSRGEAAALIVTRLALRVAPERGPATVRLAGLSIRAVAVSIVVTALLQSALGGLGLWVVGVPFPGVLTAIVLVLCLAQIGPLLPLLGSVAWLFFHQAHVAGTFLLIWSAGVAMLESFLRPVLIRRGVDLPTLLVLAGVLGGLISFGIVGLFIGPVILAVTFRLMQAWIDEQQPDLPLEEPRADTTAAKFQAADKD
jgi:predicted PurR-regulated permease PerM